MNDDAALFAQKFLDACAAPTADLLNQILAEDSRVRIWSWQGRQVARDRARVIGLVRDDTERWTDARYTLLNVVGDAEKIAMEYRIQATENERYGEHNRAGFLEIANGAITSMDLYYAEPIPSARRTDYIVPANLSDAEIERLLESLHYSFDIREWMPPDETGLLSLRFATWNRSAPHPTLNGVDGVRWAEEAADAQIDAFIESFRRRNQSFVWYVSTSDTPRDLGERLIQHGLVYAGAAATMVRMGLEDLDEIPTNPEVELFAITGTDEGLLEEALVVAAVGFHLTPEVKDTWRNSFKDRARHPELMAQERTFLARLDDKPVAIGAMLLKGGRVHLGGATTLPEYRSRKIYSTMLRRRLEQGRDLGYHMATIDAEPMSRRVVSRYGFKEYGKTQLYVWMPVIDMDVIHTIVPDE